jgi:OmpR family response regulator RpaB
MCIHKILVVDNDINTIKLLETQLNLLGYKVVLVSNGKDALTSFIKEQPDLVILEIVLPKLDGYEICRMIRESSQVPIIILTALNNISDRLMGLESGADDYITKPFSKEELSARIKSLLRRSALYVEKLPEHKLRLFHSGNLNVDLRNGRVVKDNLDFRLTRIEREILELLFENIGEPLSRSTILDNVWGYTPERFVDTRIVDVHISRLRSKIEQNPNNPDLIVTKRGVGYMFQNYK